MSVPWIVIVLLLEVGNAWLPVAEIAFPFGAYNHALAACQEQALVAESYGFRARCVEERRT